MNPKLRLVRTGVLGSGLIMGVLGLSGCSEQAEVSGSKKAAESKRDSIQKSTQAGVPGKSTSGPGGRAR